MDDNNAEEWLATEDPTEGDLPATEFIGSTKDLSQSVDPEEGDGTEIAEVPEAEVPAVDTAETPEVDAADVPEAKEEDK